MKTRIIDCDVFCTKTLKLYGDIAITGNFYSSENVDAHAIYTGEDIYLISTNKSCLVDVISLKANGMIFSQNVDIEFDEFCTGEGLLIDFNGSTAFE